MSGGILVVFILSLLKVGLGLRWWYIKLEDIEVLYVGIKLIGEDYF